MDGVCARSFPTTGIDMSAIPILMQRGESLLIRDDAGGEALWEVKGRKMSGYLLQPCSGGDARTWTDDEIFKIYVERRLKHFQCNQLGIASNQADMLQKTWDAWPEKVRRTAERRFEYVKHVNENRKYFRTWDQAFDDAATAVFEEHQDAWRSEDLDAAAISDAQNAFRRTIKPQEADQGSSRAKTHAEQLIKPSRATVRSWFISWDKNGRDIRLLIPRWHDCGRRQAREPRSSNGAPDTYSLMDEAIRNVYLTPPRKTKQCAHGMYRIACEKHGVKALSYRSFNLRINHTMDDRDEHEKHFGKAAADLRFGLFGRTKLPERPLQEVEVDHCLIDLIVTHPVTGRVLGRPWLTVMIDRATRVILGVHLSFEVPSYAALQRCLAHAIWPKDLSGIEGLSHDWPCHGIPELLITDNGKDFRSRSLLLSSSMLGFTVVPLPVKKPWLKGMIERLFSRMGVQVFSLEEGSTRAKAKDFYDPVERAQLTLTETRDKILRWIVDDYHHTRHDTLKCTPMERFRLLASQYPVRPVPDFDHIVRLTGQIVNRKISNVGIRLNGLIYLDESEEGKRQLEALRSRRGGLKKEWLIRIDPYDVGEVHLLDDDDGRWITIPCTDQTISRGVSLHQHDVHLEIAQRNLPKGAVMTSTHIEQAMGSAQDTALAIFADGAKTTTATKAARYATTGEFFTPIHGFDKYPTIAKKSIITAEAMAEQPMSGAQSLARSSNVAHVTSTIRMAKALALATDLTADIKELAKTWNT